MDREKKKLCEKGSNNLRSTKLESADTFNNLLKLICVLFIILSLPCFVNVVVVIILVF